MLVARGIARLPSDTQPLSKLPPQRGAGNPRGAGAAENELQTCQNKGSPCIYLSNFWQSTALIK